MVANTTTTDKRLDDLREDVNKRLNDLREDVNKRLNDLREDIHDIRADIRQIRNWMFAGGIAAFATLIATLLNIFIGS